MPTQKNKEKKTDTFSFANFSFIDFALLLLPCVKSRQGCSILKTTEREREKKVTKRERKTERLKLQIKRGIEKFI